ncbi:helix-turn-helix domain-containing protein [Sinomicrobium weinanense]|uniref:Helix-turn-helix transcriptional regulator n=1 Tax=Sinomicrobium weinanense TaxID=2842200 RepID=A0A926JR47_9FLAO|nr:AraC family transcriptional regulator [Sinomicrobium weinanense]MBC9795711.1 helix-turn-helix transcriptional regulator [Sinomicrobium weinanense]MBU3125274.1 AraC family transcriptional regulator [Sinomicrobium weinanense]
MDFQQFIPSNTLKPYIRHYYLFESASDMEFEDTVLPSGDMEMIFNLGDGIWEFSVNNVFHRTPPTELWGQITKPLSIRSRGKHTMVGIKFFTHSAAYFLNDEIRIFNDHVYDLYEVMGHPIRTLHGQLLEAADMATRIRLIESFLIKKLIYNQQKIYKIDRVGKILETIKDNYTENNLRLVASKHHVTPRYLHKLINQYTGLTPKSYNKIKRFQRSLMLISRKEETLTSIAYNCGYFDQSHFIRDFKWFTGSTPSSYMNNITPVNQLLLP